MHTSDIKKGLYSFAVEVDADDEGAVFFFFEEIYHKGEIKQCRHKGNVVGRKSAIISDAECGKHGANNNLQSTYDYYRRYPSVTNAFHTKSGENCNGQCTINHHWINFKNAEDYGQ